MLKNLYQKYGYLILFLYVIAAYFYMPLGMIAIVCMLAPIVFALLGKRTLLVRSLLPTRKISIRMLSEKMTRKHRAPAFLKSTWFRVVMVIL